MQTINSTIRKPSSQPSDSGILHSAVELFTGRTGHSTEEKRVFLELARNLLPATSVRDRRQIANMLVTYPEAPDALIDLLAQDKDDLTAFPILRHSTNVSVDLLVEIVKVGSEAARKALAGRPHLQRPILAALCETADAQTIKLLIDREDLILDQHLNERLSKRTDLIAELGEELSKHQALNTENLISQFLVLPASLRAKAIAAAETMSVIRSAQAPAHPSIPAIDTARLRLHGALLKAALLQKRNRFTDSLGQGLSLPSSVSDSLLQKGQGEALVIALKSLGLDRPRTTTILVRLLGEHLAVEEIRKLLFLHRNLSTGAANVLTGSWTLFGTSANTAEFDGTGEKTPRHVGQFEDASRPSRDARSHRISSGTTSAQRVRRGIG
ncbi:hypothetical protein LAX5112_01507 [Roseibium alexandrii]|uniref:DUF2336 domain-containing protein n=1 Tax=Roseibium alexandrii TaxID=388408 RepID=A0A0M6ZZW1_9HYPH|nr:hypothetical protein LAX5112_01507 [Roseibium alexandrii]